MQHHCAEIIHIKATTDLLNHKLIQLFSVLILTPLTVLLELSHSLAYSHHTMGTHTSQATAQTHIHTRNILFLLKRRELFFQV